MMLTTEQLFEQGNINPTLRGLIKEECPYCEDSPIMRNLALTKARCGNPHCVGHLQHKCDSLMKYLKTVKGVGPAYFENLVISKGFTNAVEAVSHVIQSHNLPKPSMYLWEVVKFLYIPGKSGTLEEILAGYYDFNDYLIRCKNHDEEIIKRAKDIREACEHVKLRKPLAQQSLTIMITGSINGYGNRQMFVDHVNSITGKYIRVVAKSKNQSVDYLITEDAENIKINAQKGIYNLKTEAAIKGRVPIITPREFLGEITARVQRIIDGDE